MAKKKNNIKSPAAVFRVAQSRDEAVAFIQLIGDHQRQRERLRLEMDDQIAAIRAAYDARMTPHADEIRALSSGVHLYAEANRAELTNNGKVKTVNLMTGEIRWRVSPPACKTVRIAEAIEELKARKLDRFLRTKEEINKEAILADPNAVAGLQWIQITQGEDFVIVPFETKLEEVA